MGEGEGLTDEQADMERNARRRAEAERETESVMREYNREAKQKERVSLVITHTRTRALTERKTKKGSGAAVPSRDEAAGKQQDRSLVLRCRSQDGKTQRPPSAAGTR